MRNAMIRPIEIPFSWGGALLMAIVLGILAAWMPLAIPALVAVASALFVALVLFRHPFAGFILYLCLIPFHSGMHAYMEHGLNAPSILMLPVTAWKEGIIAILAIRWALESWLRPERARSYRVTLLDAAIAASLAVAVVLALSAPSLSAGLYGVRNNFFGYAVYFLARWVGEDPHFDGLRLAKSLLAVAIVEALFAITAYFAWGTDYFTMLGLIDENGLPLVSNMLAIVNIPRAIGTFSSANELGMYLALAIVLLQAFFRQKIRPLVSYTLFGILLLTLLLTVSRSAALALMLFGLLAMRRERLVPTVTASVLAFALILIVVQSLGLMDYLMLSFSLSDPSSIGHISSLADSLSYWLQHPFGIGSGMVGPRAIKLGLTDPTMPHPESFFLLLLLENGVQGFLAYLLALCSVAYFAVGLMRRGGPDSPLGHATLGILVVTSVISGLLPIMQNIVATSYLWGFAGLVTSRYLNHRNRQ